MAALTHHLAWPLTLALTALVSVAHAQQQVLERRTLKRTEDTLVIGCKVLGDKIIGVHKSRIRLYACRDGFMTPISFQVDERGQRGGYCYDRGPKERRKKDNDRGGVDTNDELVIVARDAGDRAPPQAFGLVPGYSAVQELLLTDPLDGGKAWVYVFRFDGMAIPGQLQNDYVSLKVKRHSDEEKTYYWRGERFAFNNNKSRRNAVRATFATLVNRDENVKRKPNMIDSTQVRAVVSFMWVTVVRQSNDIRVEIGGIIDGPLRMITENRLKVYLALGIWVSAPESYVMLWRNKVSMPTNAECPVNLDEGDESSYTLCMDFSKQIKNDGWKFYNSHNKTPVSVDGRWSNAERKLDMTYPDWNCIYGPSGAVISKFVIPPKLRNRKGSRLVYVDNDKFRREEDEAGIEFEPGAIGYHGYYMDMRGLKKGLYPGDYVVWYAPAPFKPGDEAIYLNEYSHPIEVTRPATPGEPKKD